MARPMSAANPPRSSGLSVIRNIRAAGLIVALGLVVAACAGNGPGKLPTPPEISASVATTTTDVDYSEVGLKGVAGRATTTSVPFGPGKATVSGVVVSEGGAVPGASVILERIVDGAAAQITLTTGEDGTWTMPNVLGGRYRARAFRQPDLAQTTPSAVFVGATETKQVELRVRTVGGLAVSSSLAPDPPQLFRDTQLVVLVSQKTVDAQGVVRATPLVDTQVDLVGSSSWRVMSANPAITDSQGHATWIVRCREAGRIPLAVTVGTQSIPLDVKDCVDPTVEETTTTADVSQTTQP